MQYHHSSRKRAARCISDLNEKGLLSFRYLYLDKLVQDNAWKMQKPDDFLVMSDSPCACMAAENMSLEHCVVQESLSIRTGRCLELWTSLSIVCVSGLEGG